MRDSLRAALLILRLTFKADPWRAAWLVLRSPISMCTVLGTAYGLKLFADAVVAGSVPRVTTAAVVLVVVNLLGNAAAEGSLPARATVIEKTSVLIDATLMEAALAAPGLAHHEIPKHRDQLELLRLRRGELGEVVDSISHNLGMLLLSGGSVLLLVRINPFLALLPVMGVPSLLAGMRAERLRVRAQEQTVERLRSARHLFEVGTRAEAGKETRVFGIGPTLLRRHRALWSDADRVLNRAGWQWTGLYLAGWLVFSAAYAGAIVLVVWLAAHGHATPGDVIMTLQLAAGVNKLVQGLVFMAGWLFAQLKTAGRVVWLTDYARGSRFIHGDRAAAPDCLRQGIRLDHVSFRYPDTDATVLDEVDLDIPAGTIVAVVGENGAGKSTLVKLLSSFYEPTGGRILVDGVDLRRIDPADWRQRMAAGFQDYVRFELLAGETVGVGDLDRLDDDAALATALTRSAALDVVDSLPDGLRTPLGTTFDNGAELSGGQWQKLALGRAMMRSSPLLLILDEPTASLDAQTEHTLFDRYAENARRVSRATGAVTVLVSHRFSTLRMADLILVLDEGRLVEYGSHPQLMARNGSYAELFNLQAAAYL